MNPLIIFSFVSFNLTSISILQPSQANEAYITTQFQDDLESFQSEAMWPENYERMHLHLDNLYNTFICKLSASKDQAFVRYQVRIVFSNRTYSDSLWQYSIWNKDHFSTYYYNFVIMIGLFITLLLLLIIIYLKIKHL